MIALAVSVVLSTVHLEGPVTADGGDYLDVTFDVPAGTKEITIHHEDMSDFAILDWGVWQPDGFRGWGGGNSEDIVIGVDQSSRSYLPGAIAAGTWHLIVGKAKLDPQGGNKYYADVTCSDTETLAVEPKAAFTPVVLSTERRWYKGDFHVHSTESGDAQATFAQIRDLAASRGLDFVNLSDHNTVSQHALIAALQPAMPNLLFLRGAEITTYAGHGNGVGISSYVDHRIGFNGRATPAMIDDVIAQGGVFIVNHPVLDLGTTCIGCKWNHPDTPWDKVTGIEIITGNYDLAISVFVPGTLTLWDTQLDAGHRIAAIGGSDDHTAGMSHDPTSSAIGSPTTLVLADGLSEAAIVDALKHGRTMVKLRKPDDPDMTVTMKTADGGDADIGDDIDGVSKVQLSVHVVGANGMAVQLWRDGATKVSTTAVDSDDFTATITDTPGAGDFRYRLHLLGEGSLLEVTSHFYVHAIEASDSGGCCSSSSGAPTAMFGMLGLAVALRRRRRAR